jgi:hypothetical protein
MPSTRMITVGEAVLEAVIEGAGETVILLPDGSAHVSYLAPLARHRAAWPKRAWRDVWLGGLVTAALFTVGKAVIGYYLRPGKRGSAYGAAARGWRWSITRR